jgi:hypothetical protein
MLDAFRFGSRRALVFFPVQLLRYVLLLLPLASSDKAMGKRASCAMLSSCVGSDDGLVTVRQSDSQAILRVPHGRN